MSEVERVNRATLPSIASKNIPKNTKLPAMESVDQPSALSSIGFAA